MKANITTSEAARCLSILESAAEPMTAAALAARLGLSGSRETQRRRIRAIVEHLRNDCSAKIVATLQDGYFLTDDDKLWRDWLDGRQIDAKRVLGVTYKQKKMLTDSQGQGVLFSPVGCTGLG